MLHGRCKVVYYKVCLKTFRFGLRKCQYLKKGVHVDKKPKAVSTQIYAILKLMLNTYGEIRHLILQIKFPF